LAEVGNYQLEMQFNNYYANTMLQNVERYQYLTEQRYKTGTRFRDTFYALKHLISNMPPRGKAFLVESFPELKGFDFEKLYSELTRTRGLSISDAYASLDKLFDTCQEWLWPNLFELHMNTGKPAYAIRGHLGNKPR
jgi:hypothetical protein